jgi:hypothetical protein
MPDDPEPAPLPDPSNPSTADDGARPPIESDLPDPSNVETRGILPPGRLLKREE